MHLFNRSGLRDRLSGFGMVEVVCWGNWGSQTGVSLMGAPTVI